MNQLKYIAYLCCFNRKITQNTDPLLLNSFPYLFKPFYVVLVQIKYRFGMDSI